MSKTLAVYEAAKKKKAEALLPDLDEKDEQTLNHAWAMAGSLPFEPSPLKTPDLPVPQKAGTETPPHRS